MSYPIENVRSYAYYSRTSPNITLDDACMYVGGMYSEHTACYPNDAAYVWNLFTKDLSIAYEQYEVHDNIIEDFFNDEEGYRLNTVIYTVPRQRSVREKLIFTGAIQVKTYTPAIPEKEFGYVRVYEVSCKY